MAIYNTRSYSSYSKNPDYISVLDKVTGSPCKLWKSLLFSDHLTPISQIPEQHRAHRIIFP